MALADPEVQLPVQPALVAGVRWCTWVSPSGNVENIDRQTAQGRITSQVIPIVCHARNTAQRLRIQPFPSLDVLELFAFVNPAQFAVPTPLGIAEALGLALPNSQERAAETLFEATAILLKNLTHQAPSNEDITAVAIAMSEAGWTWGASALSALGVLENPNSSRIIKGLRSWNNLPEWEETNKETSASAQVIETSDVLDRLFQLLGTKSEKRQGQMKFTKTCTAAFQPYNQNGEPHLVLAEAGTGIGKTLGYVAPASVWAERNNGTVWISTYTRNLQRQLEAELDRLCPNPIEKASRIVTRKGRENYLCLLNLSDAVNRLPSRNNSDTVGLGLISRWVAKTRDGDMVGGDFPAWLIDLLGTRLTLDMTDKLGECIYTACDHYRKCFIERNIRRTETADIVVANHALVMVTAAMGDNEGDMLPLRYVFDEGHHLYDVADTTFSTRLSGQETADLRRWILGSNRSDSSRRRQRQGFHERASDILSEDDCTRKIITEIVNAAQILPEEGWRQRICNGGPIGLTEKFLFLVRQQVYARDKNAQSYYDMETEPSCLIDGLLDTAEQLRKALSHLEKPLVKLHQYLLTRLNTDPTEMDSIMRARTHGLSKSISKRCFEPLKTWQSMLSTLVENTSDQFIDWFGVSRIEGQDTDFGYFRHWLDPSKPLAEIIFKHADGVLVTSASLRDQDLTSSNEGWESAFNRFGAMHITTKPINAFHPSPFRYSEDTKVLIIGDVNRNNPIQVAEAYQELFLASGGGGLGLFTAVNRLRAVYSRIGESLEANDISLFAQHVDSLDTGTLIDIFRAEENSCLLGTDALRDGIDIPGRSLRLIVFDRVPWPRPTILHKARKDLFGGKTYDDMLTRLKLKQAYGRLLRREGDRGVMVMLDRSLPTRLLNAFPSGVESARISLAEAIKNIRAFLD